MDEIDVMARVCRAHVPWFYNGFIFLTYTGCRAAEMQGIRESDIDVNNRVVWVKGKATRGRGVTRRPLKLTGPMAPAWDALVDQWQNPVYRPRKATRRRDRDMGYIFPRYQTWPRKGMDLLTLLAFGGIDKDEEVITDMERLKILHGQKQAPQPIRHGHPHMLRHTLATMALMYFDPPWDLAFLAKWLGHADVATTYRIYGHMIAKDTPSAYGFCYKSATN